MTALLRSVFVALVAAALITVSAVTPPAGSLDANTAPAIAKVAPQRVVTYHAGRPVTPDTNIRSKSGYAAWMIDEFLASQTPLPALGSAFLAAERKYGVNARILLAQSLLETGYGTSWLAREKLNLFGYHAFDRDPLRYATRYPSYQASIKAVAAAIKKDYLSPRGRFWGGLPTLRGVNLAYASDVHWADKIASLANVIDATIVTMRERAVTFASPKASGTLVSRSRITVKVAWKSRPGVSLPAELTFAARWTPLAIGENQISAPQTVKAPTWTKVTVKRSATTGKGTISLSVPTPASPGLWRLELDPRDADGSLLPTNDHPTIPALTLRIGGAAEASLSLQPKADGRLAATVKAAGTRPVGGPTSGAGASDSPVLEAWSLPLDSRQPAIRIAARAISTDLKPGQSMSVWFAVPATPSVVVVRLGGSVAGSVHAVPAIMLATRKANGALVLTPISVVDTRLAAATRRAAASLKAKAPKASPRLGITAGSAPGSLSVAVPAAAMSRALGPSVKAGTAGAADVADLPPAVLLRTLDGLAGADADPTLDRLSVGGPGAQASAAADLPGGIRLVIAALVPRGASTADAATIVASWLPIVSPSQPAPAN